MALSGEPKHTFVDVVTNKLITSYTLQHMYIAMYILIVLIRNLLMHTVIGRTADQTVRQMFSLLLQRTFIFLVIWLPHRITDDGNDLHHCRWLELYLFHSKLPPFIIRAPIFG